MTTLADNFNRANGSVGTTNYTAPAGATLPNISSNVVVASSVSIQYVALLNGTWGNDQAITMDMTRGSSGSKISGLLIRYADNGTTGYIFQLVSSGTTATLSRVDAGVATTIDSASVTGGGTFTLSAIGDTIKVEQAGVGTIMEVTDATYGSGRPGFMVFRSGSGSTGTLDNLSATDELGSAPTGEGDATLAWGADLAATGTKHAAGAAALAWGWAAAAGGAKTAAGAGALQWGVDVSATGTAGAGAGEGDAALAWGWAAAAAGTKATGAAAALQWGADLAATGRKTVGADATLAWGATLAATGAAGSGALADAPTLVRPVEVFGYDGEVELDLAVPDDNGSAITGYAVQASTNDGDTWTTVATLGTSLPLVVTGLTVGQRYDFRVAAINSAGTGPYSAMSEWGATPVAASAPITPPTPTDRAASVAGMWGLDWIDDVVDDEATSTWTGQGVRVYLIDSNFRLTHVEFAGQAFTDGYAIDGLTLGVLDEGEDHGTKVMSVAVGATVGVAYDATVVPVASHDQTAIYNHVEALQWVYDNHPDGVPGIVVTSNLWGDDTALPPPGVPDTDGRRAAVWFPLVDQLVTDLIEDKGLAFVQCIGNQTSDPHIDLDARPGLVLVSYHNEAGEYASGSEFSPDTTIIGPGASIRVANSTGDAAYATNSGTSFASPMTGGAMACWLEANPHLSPRQLVDVLVHVSKKNTLSGDTGGAPDRRLIALADIAVTYVAGGDAALQWGMGLAGAGAKVAQGAATLSWGAGATATGAKVAGGDATLTWGTQTAATGAKVAAGAAGLQWGTEVAAGGEKVAQGAAGLQWSTALDAAGSVTTGAAASLSWGVALSATGAKAGQAAAALAWGAGVDAAGTKHAGGDATVSWSTDLQALGGAPGSGQAMLTWGWGAAAGGGDKVVGADATLTWDTGLDGAGSKTAAGAASLSWAAEVAATGDKTGAADIVLSWGTDLDAGGATAGAGVASLQWGTQLDAVGDKHTGADALASWGLQGTAAGSKTVAATVSLSWGIDLTGLSDADRGGDAALQWGMVLTATGYPLFAVVGQLRAGMRVASLGTGMRAATLTAGMMVES